MEKFDPEKIRVRQRVADTLAFLSGNGLTRALSPEPDKFGEFLPHFESGHFQITRFLDSTALRRPDWLKSAEIGQEMAGFLVDMHKAAAGITKKVNYPGFSIKQYIFKLFKDMRERAPEIHDRYLPVLQFLEKGFFSEHHRLPMAFCHGDFHPLNVIWQGEKMTAVIDWEFTGVKPESYDAANLVGCAGIEHPEGLAMPMVIRFLKTIRRNGLISDFSWAWFPEYILALRFAWLSEWLRKNDTQMLETELAFMNILIRHMEELRDIWSFREEPK
jgi:homoserine kinase type II